MIVCMSVSSLFMTVSGANFPPIIAWKVSNTLGYFSFSRSNFSFVCLCLLILFRQRWKGHHQQVVVTCNVCSRKTSCSDTVNSWSEVLLHYNVINLVVVLLFSAWAKKQQQQQQKRLTQTNKRLRKNPRAQIKHTNKLLRSVFCRADDQELGGVVVAVVVVWIGQKHSLRRLAYAGVFLHDAKLSSCISRLLSCRKHSHIFVKKIFFFF